MPEPLPGMPSPPPRMKQAPKTGVRASRCRADWLCERCCQDIYRLGQASAPYPRPARWRVVEGDVVERLCEGHKVERCSL